MGEAEGDWSRDWWWKPAAKQANCDGVGRAYKILCKEEEDDHWEQKRSNAKKRKPSSEKKQSQRNRQNSKL